MAEYGFTWRFRTNADGSGMIDNPMSEPRRPLNLTLSAEEAQLLEAELQGLRADEQDNVLKGYYAKQVHEQEEAA
jgi:hypothetical protein